MSLDSGLLFLGHPVYSTRNSISGNRLPAYTVRVILGHVTSRCPWYLSIRRPRSVLDGGRARLCWLSPPRSIRLVLSSFVLRSAIYCMANIKAGAHASVLAGKSARSLAPTINQNRYELRRKVGKDTGPLGSGPSSVWLELWTRLPYSEFPNFVAFWVYMFELWYRISD